MKNPPDFVMYVVMVKPPPGKKFKPYWFDNNGRTIADGFKDISEAELLRDWLQGRYGKKNAYVQQYGPYS